MIDRLSAFFLKQSRKDGRIVILLCLAVYFLTIYGSSFFTDYTKVWRALGVPAVRQLFSDMYNITCIMHCKTLGYNVYEATPCYHNVAFAYPHLWILFAPIWVNPEHNTIFLIVIICIYYSLILLLLGRININEGIYYALLLCSPPLMLAIERGQPDLIIFILCGTAIWCMKKKLPVFGAVSLLMLAGFLKLYPLAAIISFLNSDKKASIRVLVILMIVAAGYILFNRTDIQSLNASLTKNYWSVSVGFLHGCLVFFTLLDTHAFFHKVFYYMPYPVIAYLLVGVVVIWAFLASGKKAITGFNTDYIFSFRVGASLYIGSFLIGYNYDYKFIMFIFTIPQLLSWLKNSPQVKITTLLALLAILITCWSFFLSYILYWIVYTFIEESLNWFIFGYFVFMIFNTLPAWLKLMLGFREERLAEA